MNEDETVILTEEDKQKILQDQQEDESDKTDSSDNTGNTEDSDED